jgi:Antirestriction protein
VRDRGDDISDSATPQMRVFFAKFPTLDPSLTSPPAIKIAPPAISTSLGFMDEPAIVAVRVGPNARLYTLPRYFGARLMLTVERAVCDALDELAPEYHGGYWHFYELSNGGFYMAPAAEFLRVCVPENDFDEVLSADAAGIVACLFAYGHLSSARASEVLAEHYYWLRDFALGHPEGGKILSAID